MHCSGRAHYSCDRLRNLAEPQRSKLSRSRNEQVRGEPSKEQREAICMSPELTSVPLDAAQASEPTSCKLRNFVASIIARARKGKSAGAEEQPSVCFASATIFRFAGEKCGEKCDRIVVAGEIRTGKLSFRAAERLRRDEDEDATTDALQMRRRQTQSVRVRSDPAAGVSVNQIELSSAARRCV